MGHNRSIPRAILVRKRTTHNGKRSGGNHAHLVLSKNFLELHTMEFKQATSRLYQVDTFRPPPYTREASSKSQFLSSLASDIEIRQPRAQPSASEAFHVGSAMSDLLPPPGHSVPMRCMRLPGRTPQLCACARWAGDLVGFCGRLGAPLYDVARRNRFRPSFGRAPRRLGSPTPAGSSHAGGRLFVMSVRPSVFILDLARTPRCHILL